MERPHEKYRRRLNFCKSLPPTHTALAHPCDESSLRGTAEAAQLKGSLHTDELMGAVARIETVRSQPASN